MKTQTLTNWLPIRLEQTMRSGCQFDTSIDFSVHWATKESFSLAKSNKQKQRAWQLVTLHLLKTPFAIKHLRWTKRQLIRHLSTEHPKTERPSVEHQVPKHQVSEQCAPSLKQRTYEHKIAGESFASFTALKMKLFEDSSFNHQCACCEQEHASSSSSPGMLNPPCRFDRKLINWSSAERVLI